MRRRDLLSLIVAPPLRDRPAETLERDIEAGRARIDGRFLVPIILGASITAAELVFYNSANMTIDSSSTTGGAIDTLRRPDFTPMAASDTVRIVSSNAGDTTQTVTITGRKTDGSLASETLNLNGTTVVTSSNTYERLLKAEMSATAVGTVTVARTTGPTTIRVIPAGERGFQAIFQQLASSTSGATDWYEKFFIKNTDGTLALTSSTVSINADPIGDMKFGLAASLNDSLTTANRTTAPAGISFNTTTQNVPNSGNLSAGSAVGVWMNLHLLANAAAIESTVTMEIDGNTT